MTAALALGFKRDAAARVSFLLAVPAIGLSGAWEMLRLLTGHTAPSAETGAAALALATLSAAIVSYATIAWLLRFLAHHSVAVFVAYRIVLGALALAAADGMP
jgi:undecaprenyl-diphosphatase